MFTSRRTFSGWDTAPVEGGVSNMKVSRGYLEKGLMLSVPYSCNTTTTGAAVRARPLPVRRVSIIGDNGKYIHSIKGVDLISKAMIFEQTPVGALIAPPLGFGVQNNLNLFAHLPIFFSQPHAANGDLTALPTWQYQDVTIRVEWGLITDLLTGTPVGPITITGATVTQLDLADLVIANGPQFAKSRLLSVDRYVEVVQGAVASQELELKIGNTSDIRAIILTAELTSTGEATDTIINSVTLREDNTNGVYNLVPWASLRAEGARVFGLTLPVGVGVIDFAEDGDIRNIYPARRKSAVSLFLNTAAIAGTIRAHLLTIEPSPF